MLAASSSRLTEMEPGELTRWIQNQAGQLLSEQIRAETKHMQALSSFINTLLQDLQYLQLGF